MNPRAEQAIITDIQRRLSDHRPFNTADIKTVLTKYFPGCAPLFPKSAEELHQCYSMFDTRTASTSTGKQDHHLRAGNLRTNLTPVQDQLRKMLDTRTGRLVNAFDGLYRYDRIYRTMLGLKVVPNCWSSILQYGYSAVILHNAQFEGKNAFSRQLLEFTTDMSEVVYSRSMHVWYTSGPEKAIIVTPYPSILKVDDRFRLHCQNGPAFRAFDTDAYLWRNVAVKGEWIKNPKSITADDCFQGNMEKRNAACEILGWANVLKLVKARSLDKHKDPQIGELLEAQIPGTLGFTKFLRVKCGTGRTFALKVHPSCRTALEANAWTYGMDPNKFKPEVRT